MSKNKSTAASKALSPFIEMLLGTLTTALSQIGESKLEVVLQQLHDKNATSYDRVIDAGRLLVKTLKPFIDKSGTQIDDAILTSLGNAIEVSAKANTKVS